MSERTPLIAGNWKMHKTEAEAEEHIQALEKVAGLSAERRERGGGLRDEHVAVAHPGRRRRCRRRERERVERARHREVAAAVNVDAAEVPGTLAAPRLVRPEVRIAPSRFAGWRP